MGLQLAVAGDWQVWPPGRTTHNQGTGYGCVWSTAFRRRNHEKISHRPREWSCRPIEWVDWFPNGRVYPSFSASPVSPLLSFLFFFSFTIYPVPPCLVFHLSTIYSTSGHPVNRTLTRVSGWLDWSDSVVWQGEFCVSMEHGEKRKRRERNTT